MIQGDGIIANTNQKRHPENESELRSFIESIGISSEAILKNSQDPLLHITQSGEILGMNSITAKYLGYEQHELQGKELFQLLPVEYSKILKSRLEGSKEEQDEVFVLRFPDNKDKLNSYEALIQKFEDDKNVSFLMNIWKPYFGGIELESQLKEAQGNYEALTETIAEAVVMVDESFNIIYANSSCKRVFGYTKAELIGSPFAMLFPEEVFTRYSDDFKRYFYIDSQDAGINKEMEVLGRSKNRGVSPVEISFGNSRELEQRTLICIIRDISQRKNVERKLRYLAYHDKLTELGNRDHFNADIKDFFNESKSCENLCGALLFLDLDGFKQVNDTLGHQAGDLLLIATAKRLRGIMRESDMIYRFGGDEFVVLLSKISKRADVEMICNKILQTIRRPYNFKKQGQSHRANIGVSIGVALLPDHGKDRETITRHADLAMYSSKESGKNRYTLFSEKLMLSAQNKWIIDQGLKTALVNEEMFLDYQPIVDREGSIAGVEALIRWNHPQQGIIKPDDFIPSAEESGMINAIGQWVLEHALSEINTINKKLGLDLFASVNISTRQLNAPDFLDSLNRTIKRSELKNTNIRLELTESFLMESPEKAIETLIKVKENQQGIKIVIDDFGKGYSSLHYLSRLPVDCIKIDRSFIKDIPAENNRKVINSIVNLASSLDMEMVAEGIETEEQKDYKPLESCDYFQGFLFSEALDSSALLTYIQNIH